MSIRVTDQAAGLRNEPFERSRPNHEQPETNKDRHRKGAKCILIDTKYLSYRAENDRYTGKGCYEAKRYQERPRRACLGDGRAKKDRQDRECAGSGDRCRAGQQSNDRC